MIPNQKLYGMGGAMDLAIGKKKLVVCMTHQTIDGAPKVLHDCTFPLTAKGVVDLLITDKAVFSFKNGKMILEELLDDATVDEVRSLTPAFFNIAEIL